MHTCYFFFSEINKINMNSFDFRFDRTRSKLCTKPNYGNGALSGIRFCLHTDEAWGEIDLHPVELFTFSGHDTVRLHVWLPATHDVISNSL